MSSIPARRLRAQRLVGRPFESAVQAVGAFGAVQAQDFAGAVWALGRRVERATEEGIGRLFDDGAILRTHILRPTWHFVLPEDIHWLLDLTAPRLRDRLAGRRRQLGLDERTISAAQRAMTEALTGGRAMTRPELGSVLEAKGIDVAGQRLPHLLITAELDGLLVSGPRRGKQFTYTLLSDRAPHPSSRHGRAKADREASLGALARRYFTSHGPAQVPDLAWWSGLRTADARVGIAAAGGVLERESIDGSEYWSETAADHGSRAPRAPIAHLLPNFDEYTVAYRDRAAITDPNRPFDPSIFSFGSVLSNVLVVDGVVRGAWRRTVRGGRAEVEIRVLERLSRIEAAAVDREASRLGSFLGREVATSFVE